MRLQYSEIYYHAQIHQLGTHTVNYGQKCSGSMESGLIFVKKKKREMAHIKSC